MILNVNSIVFDERRKPAKFKRVITIEFDSGIVSKTVFEIHTQKKQNQKTTPFTPFTRRQWRIQETVSRDFRKTLM